tara:strand:+ start:75 stop:692 length:618 start_codon:yes stop_codon:yes gene_type:complete
MIEYKTCGTCENKYPKTIKYFFTRKIKQYTSKGELKIYKSFRSDCKDCKAKKEDERRIVKRCKEMNCNVFEYRSSWKKQYSKTRTIDLKAKKHLTKGQYTNFLRFKKLSNIDYETYLVNVKLSKEERNNRLRNEVLSKQKYFTKEDKKLALKMYARNERDRLTNAYVANMVIRCKVSDLSPEIIETKRIIIKLKRELKSNNIKIR